jgi:hypothetical protein
MRGQWREQRGAFADAARDYAEAAVHGPPDVASAAAGMLRAALEKVNDSALAKDLLDRVRAARPDAFD